MAKREITRDELKSKLKSVASACNLNLPNEEKYGKYRVTEDNTIDLYKITDKWYVFHHVDKDKRLKPREALFQSASNARVMDFLQNMQTACELKEDVGLNELKCNLLGGKVVENDRIEIQRKKRKVCSLLDPDNVPSRALTSSEEIDRMYANDPREHYRHKVEHIERIDVIVHGGMYTGMREAMMENWETYPSFVAYYADTLNNIGIGDTKIVPIEIDKQTVKEWINWHNVEITDKDPGEWEYDIDVSTGKMFWSKQSFHAGDDNSQRVITLTPNYKFIETKEGEELNDEIGLKSVFDGMWSEIDSVKLRREKAEHQVKEWNRKGYTEDLEPVASAKKFIKKMDDKLLELGVFD